VDVHLNDILEELKQRELIFQHPELGATRADFDQMMAPDFFEFGASGRRYERAHVLDELERRHSTPRVDNLQATAFEYRRLAENVYLLTYNLLQEGVRRTRRSSIWQRTSEGWKIVFHQGTTIQDT
jgi:hypothetical protein